MAIISDIKQNMSIYIRLWIYSATEEEYLKNSHKGFSNKKFKLGIVIVNGIPKNYTSIVKSVENIKFPDSVVITKGDIRTIKYTDHTF